MKKVIALAAILGFAGSIANAQVKEFKYEGEFNFHKYTNSNTTDANSDAGDKRDNQDYNLNLGVNFNAGEDVNVQVNLINGNASNNVEFGQAYAAINNVLYLNHKFGRQFYNKNGDIVINYNPAQWYVVGMGYDAFEGWYGEWKKDKLTVNAIIGKDADVKTATAGDNNIYGVTANYQLMDLINPTAYAYKRVDVNGPGIDDDKLNVIGVKADGKVADLGLSYYGEFAMNSGAQSGTVDYTGSALLVGAALDVDLMGKWTFSAEMARGSGDDDGTDGENNDFTAINTSYRPGIIWGAATAGIGDLTTWNLGAMWNLEKYNKLTLSGKLLHFSPTEEAATYDTYGTEFDLCANWQHTENVGFKGYYAMLMADKDYVDAFNGAPADNGTDDVAYQLGVLVNVKF